MGATTQLRRSIFIGDDAGISYVGINDGVGNPNGNVIALGFRALGNAQGSNRIALGEDAGRLSNVSNSFVIGAQEFPEYADHAAAYAALPAPTATGVYIYRIANDADVYWRTDDIADTASASFIPSAFRVMTNPNGTLIGQSYDANSEGPDLDLRQTSLDIATNGDISFNSGSGGFTVNTAGTYRLTGFMRFDSDGTFTTNATALANVSVTGQGDVHGSRDYIITPSSSTLIPYDALFTANAGDIVFPSIAGVPPGSPLGSNGFTIEAYAFNINKVA